MEAQERIVDDPFPCETQPVRSERLCEFSYYEAFSSMVDGDVLQVTMTLQMFYRTYYIGFSTGHRHSGWEIQLSVVPHIGLPASVRSAHIENWLRSACRYAASFPYKNYEWSDVEMPQAIDKVVELIVVDSFLRLR